MRTSQKGIDLIKEFEGFVDHPYKPVKGEPHWTWGYGHFGPDVPSPKSGRKITRTQAETLLRKDLQTYEDAVNRLVKTHINQNRFDALVSLCYNIGPGNFAKSSVLSRTNKRQFKLAACAFLLWDKGGVPLKVLPGLTRRRRAEARLFLRKV